MKRQTLFLLLILVAAVFTPAQSLKADKTSDSALAITLPNAEGSVKFMAIGDTGRGSSQQNELGKLIAKFHSAFGFDSALLTGDNLYGKERPKDYKSKFEDPYRTLLDRNVKFYASLGNHDEAGQRNYEHFNMNGEDYYRFVKGDVAFYALNSNYLDKKQLDWFVSELEKCDSKWKIAFFHHPPYSSGGRHGSDTELREIIHPLFIKYGIDVVFTGHDHFYERIKPQDGIHYFVTGAGGKIRKGDIKERSGLTARGFDSDLSFMLVEIVGDAMHFQVISRTGATVDSGVILNREIADPVDQTTGGGK